MRLERPPPIVLLLVAAAAHVAAASSGSRWYGAAAAPAWAAAGLRSATRAAARVAYGPPDGPARDPLRLAAALVWVPSVCFAGLYHSIRLADPSAYADWPPGADGPVDAYLAALLSSLGTTLCIGVAWLGPVAWYARLASIAHVAAVSCGAAALLGRGRDAPAAPPPAAGGPYAGGSEPYRARRWPSAAPPAPRLRVV